MKINSLRIFSVLIIAIIILSVVESRKKNKKEKAKKLNRMASEAASMVKVKGFDWEKDSFLKELKDQNKYLLEANSTKKWFLIKMVIGKVYQLLGVKDDDVFTGLKQLDDVKKLKAFETVMKFQKTMDLNDLKPLSTDYTFKGLTETNFTPDKRTPLLTFLNCHIRQN